MFEDNSKIVQNLHKKLLIALQRDLPN